MPSVLGRELTGEERKVEAALRHALLVPDKRSSQASVRALAAASPEEFIAAALAMLESKSDRGDQHRIYTSLLECPEFLLQLFLSDQFDRSRLLEVCRGLKEIDDLLDVRLARLAPGRYEDAHSLPPEAVLRLLDILHVISSGPRLIQVVAHLAHHPDERVASKAAMLIGRRLRNHNWVLGRFESQDPRIRANVVEGLWGVDTPFARKWLWDALKDENCRVVGNALMALHLLREPAAAELVERMLGDARPPFRRTAAWLMGKIAKPEFEDSLRQAVRDEDPGVRQAVKRALAVFQKRNKPAEGESTPAPEPPGVPAAAELAAQPQEEKKLSEAPEESTFIDPHFDGKYITGLEVVEPAGGPESANGIMKESPQCF
jgi:HEAT repeat protein